MLHNESGVVSNPPCVDRVKGDEGPTEGGGGTRTPNPVKEQNLASLRNCPFCHSTKGREPGLEPGYITPQMIRLLHTSHPPSRNPTP